MKYILLRITLLIIVINFGACSSNNKNDNKEINSSSNNINNSYVKENQEVKIFNKPEKINNQQFIEKVFNYKKYSKWVYEGKEPCIIDFYADWCAPCKMSAPIYESLAIEYSGKIRFYKINTDSEPELANYFKIKAIPSFMFCPMQGNPEIYSGFISKDEFKQIINRIFKENLTYN
ncbi:MAG TPA: thioredoxin domain-containing protein [Bacteroidales bacterium]|nr:thioredoxin domain-containing protein [Bacteroidales bacterium]